METFFESIIAIDHDKQDIDVISKDDVQMKMFVHQLFQSVQNQEGLKQYTSSTMNTEVISCIREIIGHMADRVRIDGLQQTIAKRLLVKEMDVQNKIEHNPFYEDKKYSRQNGFPEDQKKGLWKFCILYIDEKEGQVDAEIFSKTVAKYWYRDFLELQEVSSDEQNTANAFRYIDKILTKRIRPKSLVDYNFIRNNFIFLFRNNGNSQIDYFDIVNQILGAYVPLSEKLLQNDISETSKVLRDKEKLKFDTNFIVITKAIHAYIKKIYPIREGMELKITDGFENLKDVITANTEPDGKRYLKIYTTDSNTFASFAFQDEIE